MGVRFRGVLITVLALGLIAAACGDDDSATGGNETPDTEQESGAPTTGGVLRFATFLPTQSLDPLVNSGFGVAGGIELLAVYDSLMRWDPETGAYEPRMAESLDNNDDFTEWTLTLKPNIEFTDGTPLNAEAVKFNLDRHRVGNPGAPPCEETRSCPSSRVASASFVAEISKIEVVDDLTVRITLHETWPSFPLVLAGEPGMIVSPTAVKDACAPETPARECDYGLNPVGAGPFKLESFKPGEEVRLVRNDTYYGGEVYLDGVTFLSFGDGGGTRTLAALDTGGVDVAFLRTADATADAHSSGFEGYSVAMQAGAMSWLNNGITVQCQDGQPEICAGRPDGPYTPPTPTSNVKVRRAISAAIDRDQLDQRVSGGKGFPGAQLFQETYRLYPEVEGPDYDLELARRLVEEAKSEGWDGRVRLFCSNSEASRGIALETMMEAAGIDVELNNQLDSAGMIQQVNVKRDFDVACSGLPIASDDLGLFNAIEGNFRSDAPRNRIGYQSSEMDAALDELHVAVSDDDKRAALKKIAEIYAKDVPVLVEGALEEFVAWSDKVHGVYATQSTEVYLDKAWLAS